MNIKTFLSKTNTIIKNSKLNTGISPICELYYGDGYTRVLLKFETDKIQQLLEDKTFSDITKLKHVLKLKNCWGLQPTNNNVIFNSGKDTEKERTSSFDLYLLRVPEIWDGGSGNDFTQDGFLTKNYIVSENGSNWYNSKTETNWLEGDGCITGITNNNTITVQHFDYGNEDIEMDVTDEINSILMGSMINNGYILCFPKELEDKATDIPQYVGFFSSATNTWFKPYVETTNEIVISDDRANFYLDKDNKLYFYSVIGGNFSNLDEFPTCTINNTEYEVKQASKGIYYIDLNLISSVYEKDVMLYDIWSNIKYNGKSFPDAEMDFVTKSDYFNFGVKTDSCDKNKYIPNIYGIKMNAQINRGQIIKLGVQARIEYTNQSANIDNMEIRIYVLEGDKEITYVNFEKVEKSYNENFYMLDTDSFLPNKYYIDLKVNNSNEIVIHKNVLKFEILSEL